MELLLALSLMAVLITLIFSAFHMGSRAWEKGENLMHGQQLLRVVPELTRRQLASLATPQIFKQNERWFYLRGESNSIDFFSYSSLYPTNEAGIVYVQYRVREEEAKKEKLSFYEQDIDHLDLAKLSEINDGSYLDLLFGYTSIAFAFMAGVDIEGNNSTEWLSSWNPDEREGLPAAIRLSFKKDTSDPPIVVIIPIVLEP